MKNLRFLLVLALGSYLGALPAWAGNGALDQTQAVPTGERVASYLQTMLAAVGQLMSIKHPPGLVTDNNNLYRPTVLYDLKNKAIDISLIGTHDDVKWAKALVDLTKNEVLSFNKKLQEDFGVTLADSDLEISYLNVTSNKILLTYKNGEYSQKFAPEPPPGPVKKEDETMPGGNINGAP